MFLFLCTKLLQKRGHYSRKYGKCNERNIYEHSFEQNLHLVETKEILRVKFEPTFRLITYLFFDHLREDFFFHQEIERKQVLYFWKQVSTYLLDVL